MPEQWNKLVVLVLVAGGTIFLGATRTLAPEAVAGMLSACLGYVFGNGHGVIEARRTIERKADELVRRGADGDGH